MDQEIENYFKKVNVFLGKVAHICGGQHGKSSSEKIKAMEKA